MDGEDIVCNFKKCRKRLTSFAYVTSCSHVFCDEDGTREFSNNQSCPACNTPLVGKFEIVRTNLQPSEQYKSMILAGLKPDVIMETASRALAFWTYQAQQENTYQQYMATKSKERALQLEQYYEQIVEKTNQELTNLKMQLASSKKDLDETKRKYNGVSDKMMEKSRQYQKLQSLYDGMRRKLIKSGFEGSGDASTHYMDPSPKRTHGRMHAVEQQPSHQSGSSLSHTEQFSSFQPNIVEDMMTHPANSVQRKFSVDLGTPRK